MCKSDFIISPEKYKHVILLKIKVTKPRNRARALIRYIMDLLKNPPRANLSDRTRNFM